MSERRVISGRYNTTAWGLSYLHALQTFSCLLHRGTKNKKNIATCVHYDNRNYWKQITVMGDSCIQIIRKGTVPYSIMKYKLLNAHRHQLLWQMRQNSMVIYTLRCKHNCSAHHPTKMSVEGVSSKWASCVKAYFPLELLEKNFPRYDGP